MTAEILCESFKVHTGKKRETKWIISLRPTPILQLMFNKALSFVNFTRYEFL